jgi:D-alanyl-D-alanine carboxypeptidase/D-alanyl-D-alanine-endopeptidase (penicillin-binding protein 4)
MRAAAGSAALALTLTLTLALALSLAGCGGATSHRPAAASRPRAASHRPPPRPRAPPALVRLERSLARSVGSAGAASGASVYDLTSGKSLFALRDTVKRPPASLEKLYTTVALVGLMGPNARLHTGVLATGHLGAGGVWRGNLYLRGGGDPTFGDGTFNRVWEMGYGPTAATLADQLAARGIRRVAGRVIGDDSLFDNRRGGPATDFAPDVPDFGGQLSALTYDHGATVGRLSPAAFAARQLALTLRARGIRAFASTSTATAPRRARPVAGVDSPPLATLISLMNVPSDDLFAELLTKQLGVRFGRAGTIAAGAQVIHDTIAGYAIHPQIVDGSGLSRANLSSPAEIVALLSTVWRTTVGHVLSASLPVVGLGGTVRNIGVHTAAQGHCIGKTGTLNDVTNLAGYCHSRGGDMVTFSLLLDGPPNERALPLLSQMVAAIARY